MALTIDELKRKVAECAKDAGNASKHNGRHSAMAELTIEVTEPTHLSLELFSAFMNTVQKKKGDFIGKRVRRGRYPIRTMVPGSMHMTDKTDYVENMFYQFDRLIAGTSCSLWELRQGDVDSVAKMQTDLRADLFDNLVARVFTLLSTVWNSTDTPNNYVDASGSGVTETGIDTLIENITEYAGSVRAIMGSRKALMPLYKFAQFREFTLSGTGTDRLAVVTQAFEEFTRSRKVTTYYGIPVIELPQVYSNRLPANTTGNLRADSQKLIPTDKILVIGGDPGQIILYDEFEYQDYEDPKTQPPNYVLHGWQAYAMVVDDVEQIGVIKTNT